MPIGFLGGHQIDQHLARLIDIAGGEQSTGAFDQIARPNQVIAAQIIVTFIEAPRNRQARDHRAAEALGLVGLQDRGRDPVEIEAGVVDFAEIKAPPLEILPLLDVIRDVCGKILEQRAARVVTGFRIAAAKSQREYDAVARGNEVQLGGECDVAVGRFGIEPGKLFVGAEILPAVACADVTTAHRAKRHRGGKRQRRVAALREQHRSPLPVTDPRAVTKAAIADVRRE